MRKYITCLLCLFIPYSVHNLTDVPSSLVDAIEYVRGAAAPPSVDV